MEQQKSLQSSEGPLLAIWRLPFQFSLQILPAHMQKLHVSTQAVMLTMVITLGLSSVSFC